MENATKALLIAGGVLIAIIIIAMFIMMFSRISNIQKEQEEKTKLEQLSAFNAEFEAYNKKAMYGTDVKTLINKVVENNKTYSGNSDFQIMIVLNGSVITSRDDILIESNNDDLYIYKCTKMEYNEFGRVCKIIIQSR